MMRFRNIAIQRKLTLIIMLTCLVALLLATLAFITYEFVKFRQVMIQSLTVTARVIGANSTAALSFNDADSAEQTLSALRADAHIMSALIFTKDGKLFATYRRLDVPAEIAFHESAPEPDGPHFEGRHLGYFHGIMLDHELIGTVYVQVDLIELRTRLQQYAGIAFVVLLVSSVVAFLLSSSLQRVISQPILDLAQITKVVSKGKNYTVRATKQSEDELGSLTDGFNEMLTQIQQRDTALQAANESLEKRVAERTGALKQANDQLQHELGERARAEEATRKARAFSDWVINSLPGVFYLLDETGRFLRWNKNFELVTGYAPEEMARRNALDYFVGKDQRLIQERIQQVFTQGAAEAEAQLVAKDGTKIPYYFTGVRISIDDKPCLIGTGLDITARKQAETELENLHKQLLDVSRSAGMAEVATNVLHNVGNVLNSVNVSTALVSGKVRTSKVTNLGKAAALLREHANDLPVFLTQDPKGAQLPGYLASLAEHLTEEQTDILKELQSLTSNIDHIKEIVAMQQNYAKVSGVLELVAVDALVEDALRMNTGALARHEVQVVREFTPVPPVVVDKHKVLQILVNLIRNAKYALDDGGRGDKRLTLRMGMNGDGFVKITVMDNGVGIRPENLTRIFEHGFTTRKDGHGFGLHSGALAARELGGSLTAHSEGLGQGAVFTLALPYPPPEKAT